MAKHFLDYETVIDILKKEKVDSEIINKIEKIKKDDLDNDIVKLLRKNADLTDFLAIWAEVDAYPPKYKEDLIKQTKIILNEDKV